MMGFLNYFNDKKEYASRRKIKLTNECKVKADEKNPQRYVLEIETKTKTRKFFTDSRDVRDSWCSALNQVIQSQQRKEETTEKMSPPIIITQLGDQQRSLSTDDGKSRTLVVNSVKNGYLFKETQFEKKFEKKYFVLSI